MFETALLQVFAAVVLIDVVAIVTARNRVHAVHARCCASSRRRRALVPLLCAEFLAIRLLLVSVGVGMVLF